MDVTKLQLFALGACMVSAVAALWQTWKLQKAITSYMNAARSLATVQVDLLRRIGEGRILVTADDGTVGQLSICPEGDDDIRIYVEPSSPPGRPH